MKQIGVGSPVSLLLASALTGIIIAILPMIASADTVVAQTAQLLPPGQNTCAPVTVGNFAPHVYAGSLDSFDFTISDASYVAVVGSVGDTSIPFRYMTRSVDATGALHVHVDINSTPVTGTLPVRVTMLSSKGSGQPTCATLIAANVGSGPVQSGSASSTTYPTSGSNMGASSAASGSSAGSGNTTGTTAGTSGGKNTGSTATGDTGGKATTSATATSVVSSVGSTIAGFCTSTTGSYRLWLGLLIIYAILVGIALWAEFPASVPWMRTPESVAVAILVGLLILLGFWYFAVGCRSEFWMPLVAVLIAILGILAAFRNHPRLTQLLLLEDAKKK